MSAQMISLLRNLYVRRSRRWIFPRRFAAGTVSIAAALVLLGGCEESPSERRVHGQMFILSPEGQVLRLGSVEVMIFEEREVGRYLDRTARGIGEQRLASSSRLDSARDVEARFRAERVKAESAYQERDREIREELDQFLKENDAQVERVEKEIAGNEAFIAQVGERPAPPAGIPSRSEYEEFAKRRSQWLSMSAGERESWAEVLVLANRELEMRVEEIQAKRESTLADWSAELQSLDAAVLRLGERIEEATVLVADLEEELAAIPGIEDYLTDLPPALHTARTDADGEFEVMLPSGKRYGLYARADRYLSGEVREYQWLVWMDTTSRHPEKVLLSNHNLLLSGSEESILAGTVDAPREAGL